MVTAIGRIIDFLIRSWRNNGKSWHKHGDPDGTLCPVFCLQAQISTNIMLGSAGIETKLMEGQEANVTIALAPATDFRY